MIKKVDFHKLGNELRSIANIFRDDALKTTEYLEEFSYFLFLKLFDDQEKQKEEMAKLDGNKYIPYLPEELRFYTWANKIINGETPINEVIPTVKKIFQDLAVIKDHDGKDLSLFRRLFRNHIWRIKYGPTIRDLLKRLVDLELEQNFDAMGRAYEFVVQELGEQKQYGQYFTPRHIIHFMVELADPEPGEKIYDPAAGTGGFILRTFEVVSKKIVEKCKHDLSLAEKPLRELKEKDLWAVEKAPDVYKLALMNMILHNDGKSNLYEADSLDNRAQVEHKQKHNVVLSNPPYGPLTQSRVGVFDYHVKRFEALFIQHIMNALKFSEAGKKPSRAVVIILDKILFDSTRAFKNIRKKLLREYNLKAVFSMPAGIFQPYSGVKTTVLYFERPTKDKWHEIKKNNDFATQNILFFEIKSDGFTLSTQRRPINGAFQGDEPNIYNPPCGDLPKAVEVFREWQKALESGNIEEFKEKYVDNQQVWIADIEEIKEKDFNLNPGLYRRVERGKVKWELVPLKEVLLSLESGRRPKGGVNGISSGVISIGGEHIDESGGLKFEGIKYIPSEFFDTLSKGVIQEKDILIVKDGATTGKVAIVKNLPFEKAAVNEHVFLLRVDKEKILPEFLFYILWSGFGQKQILNNKKGAAQGGISRDFVENVYTPLPPLEVQQKIVERLDKQQAIIEKAQEMEKAILEAGIDDAIFEGDWDWVELGDERVTEAIRPGSTPRQSDNAFTDDKEIPFIKSEYVQNSYIDFSKVEKYIKTDLRDKYKRNLIRAGDVLFNIIGASIGRVAVYKKGRDAIINQNICLIRTNKNKLLPEFLMYFLLSSKMQSYFGDIKFGGGQPALSATAVKHFKIPLPPLEKQKEIVEFLDVQFQALEKIRQLCENAEKTIKLILEKEVFGDE